MSKKRAREGGVVLDDGILTTLKIGSAFSEPFGPQRINSIDFHREEDLLVAATDDDCLELFDVFGAKHLKSVSSRKYGCRCVTYTHHRNCVLVASAKGDTHAVRYLSLHDNRWLRFFDGHSERVTTISMSPADDMFLSAGEDHEVRLWDLRTPNCQAMVKCPGLPCAAFDQQGLVFSIASSCGVIKLFDVRGYDKGPFATFALKDENCSVVPFSFLKFSYDGQKILAVNEGHVYVLEAFQGGLLLKLNVGTPAGGVPLEASFTPDGQHVISACYDKKIRIWNVDNASKASKAGETVKELIALEGHIGVPACVKWAPRRATMASACNQVALWIPSSAKIQEKLNAEGSANGS